MQGKVLSLSYPAIKFIHFELAELFQLSFIGTCSFCQHKHNVFLKKSHQQVSVYLSILFPSKANIVK